jgi:hypothetical protein
VIVIEVKVMRQAIENVFNSKRPEEKIASDLLTRGMFREKNTASLHLPPKPK